MAAPSSTPSLLSPTQRYAAGALFGLALHEAQLNQTNPLPLPLSDDVAEQRTSTSSSSDSVSDDPDLWVHSNSGLLRPVFKFLDIDSTAWLGLEETAGSSSATHHVGPFLRLLSQELDDGSSQRSDQELALSSAVDGIALDMQRNLESYKDKREKLREYEHQCREKFSIDDFQPHSEKVDEHSEVQTEMDTSPLLDCKEPQQGSASLEIDERPIEEVTMLSDQRKVTVLYELLSGCLSDLGEDIGRRRKGYDARHRVALRLLATWLDVKWMKMEAIETMVACSAMAFIKEQELKKEENQSKESKWAKLKRGGIIGAAAITGGTLLAITGGLAAPAIAAGLGALAPTLGTLIPVIGASGFAAVAGAAGTVAGSVAVAASFGAAGAGLTGSKMARRVGGVDEFEFKAIGENHNQGRLGVEILVSGFVFEKEDFTRPWEGQNDNLERYALQWESKNLIAVSTAIQDWLTSRLAMELMKRGAMMTVLSTLLTALAWPAALIAATDFIDSKWSIAINRSNKAGKLLAEVLLRGLQGNRPVTLIGYSLGARVIFKCLQCLAKTENTAELVERVVLLGAPIPIQDENWEAARKMVAGRFINAYSRNDWMLGVAFRASLLTKGLAGIQPVDVPGIQNVDVTEHIEGHSSYLWATPNILDQLQLDTYYPVYNSVYCVQ
ncbi:transmembrane and coiled-coil domain-containing protein 4 [Cajanus cajan]|uniref:Transmembrane and coiled-coil domain-containing protein 4 n=1 Tax=Cajanus cajan TaxID=3821 RepID=A0A151R318_CAJCA|nr:transmembrane and coiled-coil domain-containing protein 4 [Cajanus cajan]KYP36926.1 Transmembrane and coiled-coil domain-containing protein 4 [Cajanus cajan]